MPFTFAHPAAVIPLQMGLKRYVSFTALVLGSMAPDFEYFLHFRPYQVIGHTWTGFIVYNFPLVLLIAYLFHLIVKGPLISHLPRPFDRWYGPVAMKKWGIRSLKDGLVFFSSAILGMCTHVFWDAFTHQNGYFVKIIPFLQQKLPILGWHIPIYKLAQHGSTLVGFLFLALYVYSIRNDRFVPAKRIGRKAKILYWTIVPAAGLGLLLLSTAVMGTELSFSAYGALIVSTLSCMLISLFLVSLVTTAYSSHTDYKA